jgi:hypothetical protein
MSNGDNQTTATPTTNFDPDAFMAGRQAGFDPDSFMALRQQVSNVPSMEEEIKKNPFRVMQIPFEHLGMEADEAEKAVHQKILVDAARGNGSSVMDYIKQFAAGTGRDALNATAGALSPSGIGMGIGAALVPEIAAPWMISHGIYQAATAPNIKTPKGAQQILGGAAEAFGGAALGGNALRGETPIQQAWQKSNDAIRRLSGAIQTPMEAANVPPASQRIPALAVSNQDVINEATAEGINLTPAQGTGEPAARTIQAVGERSITPGGWTLHDAIINSKGAFEQSIENFVRRQDPHALGLSPSSAGSALQNSAKVALEVARDNADIAYKQAGLDQQNLAVHNAGNLKTWVDGMRNVRQPGAAVAQPEYQTPAVRSAMDDIAGKPEQLGPYPSIQSMRNLRTEFWEKSQDYSGNIPDSARRLYSQAADKVDDMIMNAAKGTNFEQSFRDASSQWKTLKQKFDDPNAPMAKILSSADPKQVAQSIITKQSPSDILALKNEGIDLGPIKNQVVQNIASKGFRVVGNKLGGYSDEFLQTLFGPADARELYVKGELGRRLGSEVNPSGTSNVILTRDQLGWQPWNWARGEAAARASMPRTASAMVGTPPPAATLSSLRPKNLSLAALVSDYARQEPAEQK